MKKIVVVTLCGLAFAFCYMIIVNLFLEVDLIKADLYVNQVGIFKEQDRVTNLENKLIENGFVVKVYQKEELNYVITSFNTDLKKVEEDNLKLKQLGYNCIIKKYTLEKEIVDEVSANNFETFIERIKK